MSDRRSRRGLDSELHLLMRAADDLLGAAGSEDGVLRTATTLLGEHLGYGSCGIALYEPAAGHLRIVTAIGPIADLPGIRDARIKLDEGVLGCAAAERRTLRVDDLRTDPRSAATIAHAVSEIVAPMVAGGQLLGVIAAVAPTPGEFTITDERVLGSFAQFVALALAQARANVTRMSDLDTMRQQLRELEAVHEVAERAVSLDVDATLRAVVDSLRALTSADTAGVWLWDDDRQILDPRIISFDQRVYPPDHPDVFQRPSHLGEGLIGWTAEARQPTLTRDITTDPRARLRQLGDARAGIFVPLIAEEKLLGVLRAVKLGAGSLGEQHLRVATTLANSAALAISAVSAHEQQRARVHELASLQRISLRLAQARSLGEALDDVLAGAVEITGAEAGMVWRREASGVFTLGASHHVDVAAVNASSPNYEGSLSDEILVTGRPVLFEDMQRESRPRWRGAVPSMHALLGAPLRSEDVLYGALYVLRSTPGSFGADEYRHLEVLAAQAGSALARVSAFEDARRLAVTDELTGCFNARYFSTRLAEEAARAARYGRPLSLIVLDSDSLKKVNDRYGHKEGDRHIVELAHAIACHVRSTDVVARFGGDEFLVLQPETTQAAAGLTAERIRRAFRGSAAPTEDRVVSVSAGVASMPENATDADTLFRMADLALYEAKNAGRDRVAYAPAAERDPAGGAPGT